MSAKNNESEESPVKTNRPVTVPLLMLVGLLGGKITATMGWASLQADARTARADNVTIAERLRVLEQQQIDFASMKRDVEWIKLTMQEDRRRQRMGQVPP